MIQPGQTIELTYPDCTLIGAIRDFRERRLVVRSIRDLVAEPLTIAEYLRRPMLARSRWLLQCWDVERRCWRKFYLGSSREHERPGLLRVGLYRPGATRPDELVSRAFGPTRMERRVLARVLADWVDADLGRLQLRVLADDLALYRGDERSAG
ncbi:hypothetical protein [Allorhodopirellula heiligendammensis]|uniref:Uncharacterized protein n=1 Tax=Allorhodopirellula heiligendammensis TaxID=2714739 RepID=A0A5C6C343_9BACT|nr:hypothetical protein [Allorhodopirellula heiligendammensis]TWU18031.1 hypothetical protein Poly21_01840 [Allorhodopirellula heiligendammensis]